MIRLEDEEIQKILIEYGAKPWSGDLFDIIAKAQLKKFINWGNEPCDVKEHYELNAKKRQCEACWQDLLEEV